MTTPLSENPAVLDPRKALTPSQRDALGAIGFFKYRLCDKAGWKIGNKRFTFGTIAALKQHGLVCTPPGGALDLTAAGKLAAERLKGGRA